MGSVWDFRSGLDAAVTAHATGSRASPPGHIDSRAMTEAVADSDSFVSPDNRSGNGCCKARGSSRVGPVLGYVSPGPYGAGGQGRLIRGKPSRVDANGLV